MVVGLGWIFGVGSGCGVDGVGMGIFVVGCWYGWVG